ncbi:TRAP transporter fused permease subunit [Haloechinothrix sp. LS1_15]|uniref:TRAP transporter permease n=1 Tax=Haloechinothrix sp. LS1_15 TaxID=2652248 RepID=UPI00294664A1|nr:TRAP transporter fused permease subunit [Haloechinothrix sp. LS1_15]MDV6013837.1 TRAP transporter permease [Haloechinothrix sp. LS1_15]
MPEQASATAPPRWLERAASVGFFVVATGFTLYLLQYYATAAGGPVRLAVALVPVAYIIVTLDDLRHGALYPRLPPAAQAALAVVLTGVAAAACLYLHREFDAIREVRVGFWNTADLVAGAALILLLLEHSRRKYLPLFVLNLLLVAYVVYGDQVPGLFGHAGLPWERVVSSMSLETTTGIFERLSQLALTLIGSFILVLAVLRAFGAIDSILAGASRLGARSPHLLPQASVVGSFGVAAVSGSGAANATTTGSVTIPALIRAGFPKVRAAATETATSLGGQLMPPLMGIAAFLMANYMGVSYFDVVARGFAPALIYFAGVSFAVYLVSRRLVAHHTTSGPAGHSPPARLDVTDRINLVAYVVAIGGLIYLMGVAHRPAMQAAQQVFVMLLAGLTVLLVARALRTRPGWRALRQPYTGFVATFARMTSELTVLLAVLGLVTASFTITGVPTKVGVLMLDAAGGHVALIALLAFAFGYVVGMGLPPAPTYIVVAVVITPVMAEAGLDPWVAHFFAFLIAVFGELSPPTSLTAAVTSRIAETSFLRTMGRALELCLPLFVLMVALFTWPEVIVEPGSAQLLPALLVAVATIGLIASVHGSFGERATTNRMLKLVLAALAVALLSGPPVTLALVLAAAIVALTVAGWWRTRALTPSLAATTG